MIKPTVGRIVWCYNLRYDEGGPLAAIVCYVHNNNLVNLFVLDSDGNHYNRIKVHLFQPDEFPLFKIKDIYCTWMPYQVTKGYGSESGEKEARRASQDFKGSAESISHFMEFVDELSSCLKELSDFSLDINKNLQERSQDARKAAYDFLKRLGRYPEASCEE